MKVRENFEVPSKIIGKLKRQARRPKSYSVTRLVCCPRRTYYRMIGVKEVIFEERELIFTRGRAHHDILEVAPLREIERVKRGFEGKPIYAHIDMIFSNKITEIFTTTLSSKKVEKPEDAIKVFPIKRKQLQAYCYFEDELEGDLLVFFLFGDYTRFVEVMGKKVYVGIRPKLRDFSFEFTREDIFKVWNEMNMNIAEIEQAKKDGIPPLSAGEEFECQNCGYSYKCLGEEPVTKATDVTEEMML